MDYKIAGETSLRSQYAAAPAGSGTYVVVRPGGLSENASKGAAGVEVSQGDIYASEIGREDVALVTVAALLKPGLEGATFEVYGSGGETMFGMKTGAAKLQKDLPDVSELVHRSDR